MVLDLNISTAASRKTGQETLTALRDGEGGGEGVGGVLGGGGNGNFYNLINFGKKR